MRETGLWALDQTKCEPGWEGLFPVSLKPFVLILKVIKGFTFLFFF